MGPQDREPGEAAPSLVGVATMITVLVEPAFDVVGSIADVASDADTDRTAVLCAPAVHGRKWNAEILGELDRAEETRADPATGRCS